MDGVTGEQIAYGLKQWTEDWPPSAPEFRKCCLNQSEAWQHKSAAYKEFKGWPKLEKKSDPEFVNAQIAEMKKIMGMKSD